MKDISERVAVLESLSERNQSDITNLFALIRTHMEKEEEDRKELKGMITGIISVQSRQKSFVGGVIFAVSAIWAFAAAVWTLLKGHV